MKTKTRGRIHGMLISAIPALTWYPVVKDPGIYRNLVESDSIETKGLAGAYIVLENLIAGILLCDGLTDIVKGTHHYFSMNAVKPWFSDKYRKETDDYFRCREENREREFEDFKMELEKRE